MEIEMHDRVDVGVAGPKGDPGTPGITKVESHTLDTGLPATSTIDGTTLILGIPLGPAGPTGERGPAGVEHVSVSTLAAGADATITLIDGTLALGVPRGDKGAKGDAGQGYQLQGVVASQANLPAMGLTNYAYITADTKHFWVWNNTSKQWDDAGELVGPQGRGFYTGLKAIEPNASVNLTDISAPEGITVGDTLMGVDGRCYKVTTVTESNVTVGTLLATIRGAQGVRGNGWFVTDLDVNAGSTVALDHMYPTDLAKNVGDFLLDSQGDIWRVTGVASNSVNVTQISNVNLKGPQGPKGDTGAAGKDGERGETGPAGVQRVVAKTIGGGQNATADLTDGVLTIGIPAIGPKGETGEKGDPGANITSVVVNTSSSGSGYGSFDADSGTLTINVPKQETPEMTLWTRSGSLSGSLSNGSTLGSASAGGGAGTYLIFWNARLGSLPGNGSTSCSIICHAGSGTYQAQCAVAVGGDGSTSGGAQTCSGFAMTTLSSGASISFKYETTKSGGSITNGRYGIVKVA